MKYAFLILISSLSFLVGGCSKQPQQRVSKFHAGQVWAVKTPSDHPDLQLTILRVETLPRAGTIVFVAAGDVDLLGPFSEAAIAQSVSTFITETSTIPNISKEYDSWRWACDQDTNCVLSCTVVLAYDSTVSSFPLAAEWRRGVRAQNR
jgi:hypothetical protein